MQEINTPLLSQMQQRLLALAEIDSQSTNAQQIRDLLALLYDAQQQGNGILNTDEVNQTLDLNVNSLQDTHPALLGNESTATPITLFDSFIGFRRAYLQLSHIAQKLKERKSFTELKASTLTQIKWEFSSGGQLSDEQKLAAYSAACLPFCLITGGAGTGKTTTLTKALELILLDNPDTDILLAAPTGKAAQRLNESLKNQLECVNNSVREPIANLQTRTLHRLLAISESSGRAFKNKNNPLACQVLAIDETSMIGSDLLEQVLNALPSNAKLILLGDANQLPPINSVAFFGDMSKLTPHYTRQFAENVARKLSLKIPQEHINNAATLANHICRLSIARRFAEQSLIEQCANATLNHDAKTLINSLGNNLHTIDNTETFYQQLANSYPQSKKALLEALGQRMILSANRQGELGSKAINHHLDRHFREIISPNNQSEWYIGRQILIEKNNLDLRLSNGDIGRCIKAKTTNEWAIDFGNDHQIPVNVLPDDYSLAFAITIHKSQGSEYQHIDMVLDRSNGDTPNPLITAPLIYTAITRAKKTLRIYSDHTLLTQGLHYNLQNEKMSALSYLLSEEKIITLP